MVVIVSMLALAFSQQIYVYYISVFINGFSTSCLMAVVSMYNTEIADNDNRGRINCLLGMSVPLGNAIAYLSGNASLRTICFVGTITPSIFLVLSFFLSETPIFLLTAKKEDECLKALKRLRGTNDVEDEYVQIKKSTQQTDSKKYTIIDVFRTRASIRSFCYTIELLMTEVFSGIFLLGAFMGPIFNEAGAFITGNSIGALASIVQVLLVIVASLFIDRLGRKPLLFASMSGCVVCLAALSVYFYHLHYPANCFRTN
uniref:Major facilitator superfamily protein n=1 Tax=Phyllotreta armoraciae TaxID=1553667 RepID=A0A858Z6T1_9CUCU|nr:major facilitator superfamily protein [Phyllotreta armoraciae]